MQQKRERKLLQQLFLDLLKAFDSINHELMVQKLSILGFSIQAQNLIACYLSNRTQRVIINNVKSRRIEVAQGVPQEIVLGPLLFNLYVNNLGNSLSCETIQYADDTVLLSSHYKVLKCKDEREKAITKCIQFFNLHHLKINPDKTEFIIFGSSNPQDETTLKVGEKLFSFKAELKYLGVYIEKDLKYQKQVKILLSKMAQAIECIYALRNIVPIVYKKFILNSFVLSHVQYSPVLLATINQSLITTLEKQLKWAIKACFHRQKFDSSSDLKMNFGLLPISLLFDYRTATYCHGIMNKKKPAFSSSALKLPNASFYIHKRSQKIFTQTISKCNLHKGIIKRGILQHNSFPRNYLSMSYSLAKKKYKQFFLNEYKKDPKKTEHGSITWKHFKFN